MLVIIIIIKVCNLKRPLGSVDVIVVSAGDSLTWTLSCSAEHMLIFQENAEIQITGDIFQCRSVQRAF